MQIVDAGDWRVLEADDNVSRAQASHGRGAIAGGAFNADAAGLGEIERARYGAG